MDVTTTESCTGCQITTLMVRNLPKEISQQQLLRELDQCGFDGQYDFCYMPRSFVSGENQGIAFVNFTSPAFAGALIGAWHRRRLFGIQPRQVPLVISPAEVQGLAANLARWTKGRSRRIRNPELRAWVAPQHGDALKQS